MNKMADTTFAAIDRKIAEASYQTMLTLSGFAVGKCVQATTLLVLI